MSEEFEIIEIPFEDLDLSKTMEDEFLEARINNEIDAATNVEELREAAKRLVKVATARQAAIRGLCKRLVQYETMALQGFLMMKPAKYSKKYAKIQSKAELCTTREEALEILNKAEKLQKKTRVFTPAYD